MPSLTATTISKMKPGDILRDDVVPGLHARASGKRVSFYLYFRTPARQERRPKVGDYGVITLPQAREIARGWLLKNSQGLPVKEPVSAAVEATVRDLHTKWQELHKPKLKPETARGQECQWKVHILPELGDDRVAEVTDDDIASLHGEISEESPTQANRVLALLNTAFAMAEKRPLKWRPQNSNPCYGIERNQERRRKRHLSIEELQRFGVTYFAWEKRGSWWRKAARFFLLLLLTGARKNEIAKARREWLDLDNQILRLPDSKTGAKDIALPAPAVRLIRKMIEEEPNSPWLCPGRVPGQPINNHWNCWKEFLKEAQIKGLRIHDLRRSFASIGLSVNRVNLKEIGHTLGHADISTTEGYAHLMLPQHIQIANDIGSTINSLLIPPALGTDVLAEAEPLGVVK